ncbi:MAG: oligosaccharide repeat unit polymerase [Bacilli bacterium]|nr:oligosaccharide repeat unit polymerase [Bacilli bacterium]
MISYIILICLITFLLILSFFLFRRDYLSPSFLSCGMFDICAILAVIGKNSWNNEIKLSINTIAIIIIGLSAFILGEFLLKRYMQNKPKTDKVSQLNVIKVSTLKYVLLFTFVITTVLLVYFEIRRICIHYDFTSRWLPDMLSFYRQKSILYDNILMRDGTDINFIVKQMQKFCSIICCFGIFIFINNFFAHDKRRNYVKLLALIILCFLASLLSSGRAILMQYFIFSVFLFMYYYKAYSKKKNYKKMIIYLALFFVFITSVFYFIAPLVGRGTRNNIVNYVSFYFGTSIPSLNRFVVNIPKHDKYIGNETFSGVYESLNRYNVINYERDSAYGWQMFGEQGSNIYTSFRSYYFDFGIIGIFVFPFIFGFLINWFYKKAKRNYFWLIIYSYYSYIFIEQIRAEQFFRLLSSTTVSYVLYFAMVYIFLFYLTKERYLDIKKEGIKSALLMKITPIEEM